MISQGSGSGNSTNVTPAADVTYSLGTFARRYADVFFLNVKDSGSVVRLQFAGGGSNYYQGAQGNGASAVGHTFSTNATYSTAGAKLASFQNNSIEKCNISKDGKFACDATDSSATPGAATINKPSGQVAIAAGASSVVVTNNTVTTTSVVLCVLQTADATLNDLRTVIPAAGSFTITGNANATAAVKVGFIVFN
jgi:hypothetical protein